MSGMKTSETLTDEALVAKVKRRAIIAILLAGCPFLALGFVIAEPDAALGGHKLLVVIGLAALGLLSGGGLFLWAKRQPHEPRLQQIALRRIDLVQRKRSLWLISIGIFLLASTHPVWRAAGNLIAGEARPFNYVTLANAFGIALGMAGAIAAPLDRRQTLMGDEFSRILSIRALLTGLCALGLGTVGVFVLGVRHPLWAVQAMPLVLAYTVVIAGFTYAVMDLRADRT